MVQEKTVRPVGEAREETVDVRILSATHKSLADLVAQGTVPRDLYYRINVIELRVPPLRERSGDIGGDRRGDPAAARASRRTQAPELSAEAVQFLETYPFPVTSASSRTCWSGRLTLSTGGAWSRPSTSACVPPRAPPRSRPGQPP